MATEPPLNTVFVVESDPSLRHLIRMVLRKRYELVEAPSAALGVDRLRASFEPVIVLWDLWTSSITELHILDALDNEASLRRHAFLLLTPDLASVPSTRHQQAQDLRIPLLRVPFEVDTFLDQVSQAQQRLAGKCEQAN